MSPDEFKNVDNLLERAQNVLERDQDYARSSATIAIALLLRMIATILIQFKDVVAITIILYFSYHAWVYLASLLSSAWK